MKKRSKTKKNPSKSDETDHSEDSTRENVEETDAGEENGLNDSLKRKKNLESDENDEEPKKKSAGRQKKSKKSVLKDTENDANEAEYEVEKIIDDKIVGGKYQYLIRWKGYSPDEDTWESESTLNCKDILAKYKKVKKINKATNLTKKTKKHVGITKEPAETWNENDDFEVDKIIEVHHRKDGKREFLVSWKGFPASENSWEPEENLDCADLIERFLRKVENAKSFETKELRVKRQQTQRFTLQTYDSGRRLSRRNEGRQRVHYYDAE